MALASVLFILNVLEHELGVHENVNMLLCCLLYQYRGLDSCAVDYVSV